MFEGGAGPVGGAADECVVVDDEHFVVEETVAVTEGGVDVGFFELVQGFGAGALSLVGVDDDVYVDTAAVSVDDGLGEAWVGPGEHGDAQLFFGGLDGIDESV